MGQQGPRHIAEFLRDRRLFDPTPEIEAMRAFLRQKGYMSRTRAYRREAACLWAADRLNSKGYNLSRLEELWRECQSQGRSAERLFFWRLKDFLGRAPLSGGLPHPSP